MSATTREIRPGQHIDLGREVVGLGEDRRARLVPQEPGRPPRRIDGFTVGAPLLTGDAPHDGEVHPDGDEVLFLLSGAAAVTLELPGGDDVVELGPGDAVVVPRGVWHQVRLRQPSRLVHITPGPHGDARPLGTMDPQDRGGRP